MDKRKVIMAYRKGFITMQECAQILGIDSMQILGFVDSPDQTVHAEPYIKQSIHV